MEIIKYESIVDEIGELALSFGNENIMVLFMKGSPKELLEFSISHEVKIQLSENIKKGDILKIDDSLYNVTEIGDVANNTLKEMGHATLRFDSSNEALLPGNIHLSPSILPNIIIGSKIQFITGGIKW